MDFFNLYNYNEIGTIQIEIRKIAEVVATIDEVAASPISLEGLVRETDQVIGHTIPLLELSGQVNISKKVVGKIKIIEDTEALIDD